MRDDRAHRVAATPVTAADASGAGDAFIGCFASLLVKTGDVAAAMTQPSACAACGVTGRGTQRAYPAVFSAFSALTEVLPGNRRCSAG